MDQIQYSNCTLGQVFDHQTIDTTLFTVLVSHPVFKRKHTLCTSSPKLHENIGNCVKSAPEFFGIGKVECIKKDQTGMPQHLRYLECLPKQHPLPVQQQRSGSLVMLPTDTPLVPSSVSCGSTIRIFECRKSLESFIYEQARYYIARRAVVIIIFR